MDVESKRDLPETITNLLNELNDSNSRRTLKIEEVNKIVNEINKLSGVLQDLYVTIRRQDDERKDEEAKHNELLDKLDKDLNMLKFGAGEIDHQYKSIEQQHAFPIAIEPPPVWKDRTLTLGELPVKFYNFKDVTEAYKILYEKISAHEQNLQELKDKKVVKSTRYLSIVGQMRQNIDAFASHSKQMQEQLTLLLESLNGSADKNKLANLMYLSQDVLEAITSMEDRLKLQTAGTRAVKHHKRTKSPAKSRVRSKSVAKKTRSTSRGKKTTRARY